MREGTTADSLAPAIELMVDAISDAALIADRVSGGIVHANLPAAALFLMVREALVGQPLSERLWARSSETAPLDMADRIWGRRPLLAVTAGGEQVPVEASAIPIDTRDSARICLVLRRTSTGRGASAARSQDGTDPISEAIRRSEARLRSLVQNTADIVAVAEADGVITYASPALERVLGFEPTSWIGRGLLEFVHPEDDLVVEQALAEVLQRPGVSPALSFRLRHRDGSWRTMHVTAANLLADPDVRGVVLNLLDVTERVENERALLYQKALLEAQTEASIDGILVVNERREWIAFNQRFIDLWDLPHNVVAARSSDVALQWVAQRVTDPAAFTADVSSLIADTHRRSRAEVTLRDGRTFERYTAPVSGADGHHYGRVWSYRDVTERKRSSDALGFLAEVGIALGGSLDIRETVRRVLRLAVPYLGEWCAVHLSDADGLVNSIAAAALLPAHERALDAYRPRSDSVEPMTAVIQSGTAVFEHDVSAAWRIVPVEHPFRSLLAELGARSFVIVPLTVHEDTIGVLTLGLSDTARTYRADELVVMEDLARRLALAIDDALLYEEMQAALREATDALNVRDQFLSVASHDLRTPLGALNGQLRLALQRVEAGEPHRAVEFVSRAAVQARRLTDLVNDLFDVARLQAGVFVVRRAPMDLVATLTAVVEMECAAHPDRRIEFVCPAAIEVHGDSARLEQVFLNLVSNAIAYSPPETPIRIVVNVTAASVQVQVHDHGPGIAPEVQARIFEAYQRGDRTGASPSGLGLGLHIAREIVRLHDGTIALRSAPGRGSVFCVDLPLIGSTAAPVAAAAPGGYHAG